MDHKKMKAAVVAAILAGVGTYNGYAWEQIAMVVGPLVAYVLGQGLADIGKEAAKVKGS